MHVAMFVILMSALQLSVQPQTVLFDTPVSIGVSHAKPGSSVTVSAATEIFGQHFRSSARFIAGSDGSVHLETQRPSNGSYAGVDPMGLIWSMAPVGSRSAASDSRFDFLAPRVVELAATDGKNHATGILTRIVLSPGIKFVDVRERGLYARYYEHADGKPRRTIIVLGGAEGGLPEDRPALLASHGFNTLALAYFGVDGLPTALADIPIETVGNAIGWLRQQPSVVPTAIGIVGGSKGAELALVAAATFPQIRAVVAFSPSSVVFSGISGTRPAASSWAYRGIPLPYVNGTVPAAIEQAITAQRKAGGLVSYAQEYLAQLQFATNRDEATIRVESIHGPVLLISGDDDRLWPSSFMARAILDRLRAAHHPYPDDWLHYLGAGHEVGEPYYIATHSTIARLPAYTIDLGGSPQANALASEDAWPRVLGFLNAAL